MVVDRRRYFEPGYCYHALNRAAQRQTLFFTDEDYSEFEQLMGEIQQRIPLPILTYELMPNHWHFVVRPRNRKELSAFFQNLSGTHAKRFRAVSRTQGQGHVYQDRFKSFPVQSDGHFLSLCRYVERNALRAGLVARAEDWPWSGLASRMRDRPDLLLSDWPVDCPSDWIEFVNQPLTARELSAIRRSIRRGRPLGDPEWIRQTAEHLGLEHTLRATGRPRISRV